MPLFCAPRRRLLRDAEQGFVAAEQRVLAEG
jgi:hypothetical protein